MSSIIKHVFRRCVVLFAVLSLSPISSSAVEKQLTWEYFSPDQIPITNQIMSYLSAHSLSPVLSEEQGNIRHGAIMQYPDRSNYLASAEICQGKNTYLTLFSAQKGWFWNSFTVDLIYITTDELISPEQFDSAVDFIAHLLSLNLSDLHVLIEKQESSHLPSESKLQKWSFFNDKGCSFSTPIILTTDAQGTIHFSIPR